MQKLFYYKIGLGVIGLFTLGIFIFAVVQGAGVKQDVKTDKAAQSIATKLNDYTDTKQSIPKTLAEAGVHEDTTHITYTKLSDEKYKFCVTYKSASDDYASSVEDVVGRGLYGGVSSSRSSASSNEDQYSLYISGTHKKGENCQTVAPYMYSASDSSIGIDSPSTGSGSSSSATCPAELYPNDTHFTGVVTKIDYPAGSDDLTITVKPDSGGDEKQFTVKSDAANVYSDSCTSLPQTYFLEGDKVTVYQHESVGYDAIVDSL